MAFRLKSFKPVELFPLRWREVLGAMQEAACAKSSAEAAFPHPYPGISQGALPDALRYRGTSLIRKGLPLEPYGRPMCRALA